MVLPIITTSALLQVFRNFTFEELYSQNKMCAI